MKKQLLLSYLLINTFFVTHNLQAMQTESHNQEAVQKASENNNSPATQTTTTSTLTQTIPTDAKDQSSAVVPPLLALPDNVLIHLVGYLKLDDLQTLKKTKRFLKLLTHPLILKNYMYPKLYSEFVVTASTLQDKQNPPVASPETLYWGHLCMERLSSPARSNEQHQKLARLEALDVGKLYTMLKYFGDPSTKLDILVLDPTRFTQTELQNQIPQGIVHASLDINIINNKESFATPDSLPKPIIDSLKSRCNTLNRSNATLRNCLGQTPDEFSKTLNQEINDHGYFLDFYVFQTALGLIIINHKPYLIQTALDHGAGVDAKNYFGNTPLILASGNGMVNTVKNLLKQGAALNETNNFGMTALTAALSKDQADALILLYEHGALINTTDNNGSILLCRAADNGQINCVRKLIALNAPLDAQNQYGNTALIVAAASGRLECITALVQAKASINTANKWGTTALHAAAGENKASCVTELLALGADPHAINNAGITPLMEAASAGSLESTRVLIAHSKLNTRTSSQNFGNTLCGQAAVNGKIDCLKTVVEAGADINAVNYYGNSPLMRAAREGHAECVAYLLKRGANTTYMNCEGMTANDLAKTEEIRTMILNHAQK